MFIKKFLCGLLASLMMVTALAACSASNDTSTEEESSSTIPTEDESVNLPEEKFASGSEVIFLTRNNKEWSNTDIYSAGGGQDTISAAVFERNQLVYNRLGVKINEYKADDDGIKTAVQQALSGGLGDYHAVVSASHTACQMANSGWLRDLNSNTINYLDLENPWWDSNLAEQLSIGGHLYFATGDMMILDNNATFSLLFNKTIQEDNHIPDLYKMVEDNEWTLAKMLEYISLTSSNSEEADRTYGMLYTNDTPYAIYYGAGIKTVTKDTSDDTFNYTLDVGRADDISDKTKQIFSQANGHNITSEWSSTGEEVMALGQRYFGGGKAFLYGDVLQCVERMRSFDVKFGVLPYPLFDENQTSYYHMMHLEGSVVSIPRSSAISGSTLDMVTATMEAMAYYSPETLTKQYYDINLTSKYVKDEESGPMIDLILDTRVYDLPYYFDLTPNQNNITLTLAQCMLPGSNKSVASATGSIGGLLERKIAQLISSMDQHSSTYGE